MAYYFIRTRCNRRAQKASVELAINVILTSVLERGLPVLPVWRIRIERVIVPADEKTALISSHGIQLRSRGKRAGRGGDKRRTTKVVDTQQEAGTNIAPSGIKVGGGRSLLARAVGRAKKKMRVAEVDESTRLGDSRKKRAPGTHGNREKRLPGETNAMARQRRASRKAELKARLDAARANLEGRGYSSIWSLRCAHGYQVCESCTTQSKADVGCRRCPARCKCQRLFNYWGRVRLSSRRTHGYWERIPIGTDGMPTYVIEEKLKIEVLRALEPDQIWIPRLGHHVGFAGLSGWLNQL